MPKINCAVCTDVLLPVRDALDAISGKWKLQVIIAIAAGNHRFTEIERSIPGITPKVLNKELKDLEQQLLVKRTVHDSTPVLVTYEMTRHAKSLEPVIAMLRDWGKKHRKHIQQQYSKQTV
ncbi:MULTISPECIES: winged helix-turn-helix transcriptional regulator [Edaphocola]|jgi:DNA-binding HxlR family transcriptional regulator|uniref:winged helix-turn-helix transcriptional regulator n=1 Tax=Edaphocola TaxID=2601681 RepID=UPI00100A3F7B|nr:MULTISPECIES: helix-turn-helix domain-containing protein [Edaphocola]